MRSYERAGSARAGVPGRAIRQRRAPTTAAPIPGAGPALPPPSLRLRDLVGQGAQLPLVEHGTVHHADENLLDRSVAKQIDDPLDSLGSNLPAGVRCLVHVGPTIDDMIDITLLLQSPKHRANRRFLQGPRQFLT